MLRALRRIAEALSEVAVAIREHGEQLAPCRHQPGLSRPPPGDTATSASTAIGAGTGAPPAADRALERKMN
jgi:hypothetical protein